MNPTDQLARPQTRPFPGPELAARVGDPHPDSFFQYGLKSVEELRNALAAIGRTIEDHERILDFGCGCGRMLTWLEPLTKNGNELHGIDTDAAAIAWTREHLTFAHTSVNEPLPPTSYADQQFDLIYNHSVFTHLDEERQNAWLTELRRITSPGGHLVLTVHGDGAFAKYEDAMRDVGTDPAREREIYARDGFLFMPDERWHDDFPEWYGATYHATRYVFAHWTRWFRIKAYLPQGALGLQDIVVLERATDNQHHGAYLRQPLGLSTNGAVAGDGRRQQADRALARAEQLLARGPDLTPHSRFGPVGRLWRLALRRLIANYAVHEREVDVALVTALRSQQAELDQQPR